MNKHMGILQGLEYGVRMPAALNQPSFWILTALASRRRHGYEILRETAEAAQGSGALKGATLYAALERLEADGLIAADGEEIVAGRARRYFVITDDGASRLSAEVEQMERSARAARTQLALHKFAFTPVEGIAW
jgi:DNA-binding PadR family transcriptional regulator